MDKELLKIQSLLLNKTPFALTRFGDGEYNILNNIKCKRKGFEYDPCKPKDLEFSIELKQALIGEQDDCYYTGLCQKNEEIKTWMRTLCTGSPISASVFVNQNYLDFLNAIVPLFENFSIFFVGHINGKVKKLPFIPSIFFPIENSAWRKDYKYDEFILDEISDYNQPVLVLVAGGAYSNVLIHKIWQKDKNNILINVGSTFDPFIFGRLTRHYQKRLKEENYGELKNENN